MKEETKKLSTRMADLLWLTGVKLAKLATQADVEGDEDTADYLMASGYGYRCLAAEENVRMFGERGKYQVNETGETK